MEDSNLSELVSLGGRVHPGRDFAIGSVEADQLLDAYLHVEDADALYAEYAAKGVEFTRGLANMPWRRASLS